MKRRPFGWGIAGLLALVLARALVPAGFMPAWADGRFTLILCEGQGALPAVTGNGHHHHHADDLSPASTHHHEGDCSFAQSAHAALASFVAPPQPPPAIAAVAPRIGESWIFQSELPRHRAARGPPVST